ncbi:hypothetical protein FQZ97_1070060 [compost metagenome]
MAPTAASPTGAKSRRRPFSSWASRSTILMCSTCRCCAPTPTANSFRAPTATPRSSWVWGWMAWPTPKTTTWSRVTRSRPSVLLQWLHCEPATPSSTTLRTTRHQASTTTMATPRPPRSPRPLTPTWMPTTVAPCPPQSSRPTMAWPAPTTTNCWTATTSPATDVATKTSA